MPRQREGPVHSDQHSRGCYYAKIKLISVFITWVWQVRYRPVKTNEEVKGLLLNDVCLTESVIWKLNCSVTMLFIAT